MLVSILGGVLINEIIARQGGWLFRWRSYVLLGFVPFMYLAINQPEPIEVNFGSLADSFYGAVCVTIAFFGLAIRALTVGFVPAETSGRNTTEQLAFSLNVTGLYSLTRNPLYLGNAIIYMAVALFTQSIWFVALMLLFLILYLERIIAAEERYLRGRFGEAYLKWASDVAVFIPNFSGWTKPALGFSFRTVLRREYSGLFGIIVTFFVIDSARDFLVQNRGETDADWLAVLIVGAFVYVVLRWLKKHTQVLNVDGR